MIGKLKGTIEEILSDGYLIEVSGGVCYLVEMQTKESFKEGDSIILYTEMIIKDEKIHLYGFVTKEEKEIFLILTEVQGVGFKVAQKIINQIEIKYLVKAIKDNDSKVLEEVPGIGGKLAKRIINELKDHKKLLEVQITGSDQKDALSALLNLGFKRQEALAALEGLDDKNLSDKIKVALSRIIK
jgi:Holliday junction DNA helicase RuvA